MGTASLVTFKDMEGITVFRLTTDNSGQMSCVGQTIAQNIYNTNVTNLMRLYTNVAADISHCLPKRTSIVPNYINSDNEEDYLQNVSHKYTVTATSNYEDVTYEVRDCIKISLEVCGEEVFNGTAKQLLGQLKEGSDF